MTKKGSATGAGLQEVSPSQPAQAFVYERAKASQVLLESLRLEGAWYHEIEPSLYFSGSPRSKQPSD